MSKVYEPIHFTDCANDHGDCNSLTCRATLDVIGLRRVTGMPMGKAIRLARNPATGFPAPAECQPGDVLLWNRAAVVRWINATVDRALEGVSID